jgi:hypothetical protein
MITNQQGNIDSINQFLDKFQTAKNYNSKEIRLTINDAEQLSLGLSRLLVRQSELADKVINLQEQIMQAGVSIQELQMKILDDIKANLGVIQDGGKF